MIRLAISTGMAAPYRARRSKHRRMNMNKQTLRSAVLAMALTLGASATLTLGHSLAAPTTAQAGVLGGLKNAAKTIGGAAKKVGGAAVHAGKAVKGGISGAGGLVKRGAMKVGGVIAKTPPAKAVGKVGVAIGRKL
jgi:hypothetical protein